MLYNDSLTPISNPAPWQLEPLEGTTGYQTLMKSRNLNLGAAKPSPEAGGGSTSVRVYTDVLASITFAGYETTTVVGDATRDFGMWSAAFPNMRERGDNLPASEGVSRDVSERIKLLCRRYAAGSFAKEEAARFEILSERVRKLDPSIPDSSFQFLHDLKDELNEIASTDRAIKALLRQHEEPT